MKGCLIKLWKIVLYTLGGITALVLLAIILSLFAKPKATQSPTTTPVAAKQAVAVVQTSTSTAAPPTNTSTAEPPTSTPQPTPTPLPTDTPLPTNTPPQTSTATSPPPPTSTATDTPAPTSTPLPTLAPVAAYDSGGLGQEKIWWESKFGNGVDDGIGFLTYDNYIVSFVSGHAYYVERQWKDPVSQQDVLTEAQLMIPADGRFVKSYVPDGRPETTVRLYVSESLSTRFTNDLFTGGIPGNFTVQFNTYDGGVTRMIIAIGNNP